MQEFSGAPSAQGLWTSASYLSVTRISESCASLASVTSRNVSKPTTGENAKGILAQTECVLWNKIQGHTCNCLPSAKLVATEWILETWSFHSAKTVIHAWDVSLELLIIWKHFSQFITCFPKILICNYYAIKNLLLKRLSLKISSFPLVMCILENEFSVKCACGIHWGQFCSRSDPTFTAVNHEKLLWIFTANYLISCYPVSC